MRSFSRVAVTLLLAQVGCAGVRPRAAPDAREIAIVAATSAPRVSVAREDPPADVMTYWVGALVFPPFAATAVRGTAQLVGDVGRILALRAHAGPELHGQLADAVLEIGRARGTRLVRAAPADDAGCGGGGPIAGEETLQLAVTSVAWVPAPGPDPLLGLSVAVRGVLRGPGARCVERTLLVASDVERRLEAWAAGEPQELALELRRQLGLAGARILAELVEGPVER